MHKRLGVALFLTFVSLFLFKDLYLENRSIKLTFDADGKGISKFQVFYAKSKHHDFKDYLFLEQSVDLDKNKNIEFHFFESRLGKIKIVADKDVKIDNIVTKGFLRRIKSNDLEQSFRIYPRKKIDIKVFVIITTLSFLFITYLLRYLTVFKIKERSSNIDIAFVFIFFAFLFVPMMRIDSISESSQKENRMLAKYIPFFNDNKINNDFGQSFEKYFNDRFYGRNKFINAYNYLTNKINTSGRNYLINDKAILGKDEWFFDFKRDFGMHKMSDKEMESSVSSIKEYIEYCNKNKCKIYISIIPRKLDFAKENLKFIKLKKDDKDNAIDFIEYAKNKHNINIIYPVSEMMEANKDSLVYYKPDHHWSQWGAYIGYLAIIKEIKKDFPDIKALNEDDFNISYDNKVSYGWDENRFQGLTANIFGFSVNNTPLSYSYKYLEAKDRKNLVAKSENTEKPPFRNEFFEYEKGYNKRLMIIGDSMNQNAAAFFPYSFKYTARLDSNPFPFHGKIDINTYKNKIDKFKPDIILLQFLSVTANNLKK